MKLWLAAARYWRRGWTAPRLPDIRLEVTPCFLGAFTAPSPTFSAQLQDTEGRLVGRAAYALSPLADRWYVFDLFVDQCQRGRGYGLAFLAQLASIHEAPITPVQELHAAELFWESARSGWLPGLRVAECLSVNEMGAEMSRWHYLRAQADQLEIEVRRRIMEGESWAQATGRGQDQHGAQPAAHQARRLPSLSPVALDRHRLG